MLSDYQRSRITRRAIDDIALLNLYNVSKNEREMFNSFLAEFRDLDVEDMQSVIDLVFSQQNKSIDNAAAQSIEYIKVPVLGSLRIHTVRQQILNYAKDEGSVPDEKINEIMQAYIAEKEFHKNPPIVNLPTTIKHDK